MTDAERPLISKAARARPTVAAWLFASAFMVAAMIVIGGITRLTESGLSMVEWRPLIGWIPPLGDAEWDRVFALYQKSPEFQRVNSWMDLPAFKTIFFWEYAHRVWGRLIGVVFALPFAVFVLTGRIERALVPRLVVLFALGAAQGAIGWWMVTSGLADEPRVSPYRLAVHLSMAFLILGLLLWTALGLVSRDRASSSSSHSRTRSEPGSSLNARLDPGSSAGDAEREKTAKSLHVGASHVLAAIALTIVAGVFVAGTDAGYAYNSFPLMDGGFVPPGYWAPELGWRTVFEHVPAVQFHHRWIAVATAVLTLGFVLWARPNAPGAARPPLALLGVMVLAQVGLGIWTLLAVVPVWLGALHQGGAVALFSLAVWTLFGLRRG
ncbi:MAG: COX15/CtaA family protein [Alphaproteobacteria bacterium]|nr:COX15/CtaA family protein [Alphaproteobacteria bacterium]